LLRSFTYFTLLTADTAKGQWDNRPSLA